MSAASDQMHTWTGPALLSHGFRPFFLSGALWAACAMIVWVAMLSGAQPLPTAFDPISWHAHAFLFGYLSAIIAGFMMTAVPNWTGRAPITGWPLAGLWAVWLAGRGFIALSALIPSGVVLAVDVAFPTLITIAMTRDILAGKAWRNLSVIALMPVFILANVLFHLDAAKGGFAAQGPGVRLGLAVAVTLIALIGGRIVPSFTRNWLTKRGDARLPPPPMQRLDKLAMLGLVAALLAWVFFPAARLTAVALIGAGGAHTVRLFRWRGALTTAEPLVWVLHLAYALVPLGALLLGASGVWPSVIGAPAAQHIWMAGAVGLMTLAVMTRASLGHTGRALHAGSGTVLLYLSLVLSVIARVAAGLAPSLQSPLHITAALCWIVAFLGFALIYGPVLLSPRAP